MSKKTDVGRLAYEADVEREPLYRATGKKRPSWDQLPKQAQRTWSIRAEHKTDA